MEPASSAQRLAARLDAAVDPTTRLVYGMAEVDAPYGEGRSAAGMPLAVGLFVNAEIAGRPLENALRIPAAALRPGNAVYVVNSRDRLEMRSVRVLHQGASTPSSTAVCAPARRS